MKILYLITRAERGGGQVHVLDLLSNLPAEYKPILATGETGFLHDESIKLGVPVRVIDDLVQPVHPPKDLKALFGIIRLIRDERPDLIHAHTSKAGLLGRLAGFLTGTPTVFTAHMWSFAQELSAVQRSLYIGLEKFAGATGGQVIAVSQANVDLALSCKAVQPANLLRIWNGVADTPLRAVPGSRDSITLIMTARFCTGKDHQLLLRALAQVGDPWRLVLIGDGPSRPQVERMAAELQLSDRVEFAGDRDDVPRLLAGADIFVLATKWEGLPLSILEAMRAGLPVIATNVGGVAEAVTDGVSGYLTRVGDAAQLRDRIRDLMASRQLLRSMGHQARRRYEQDFRIDVMVNKTWSVYREVLAQRQLEGVSGSVFRWGSE